MSIIYPLTSPTGPISRQIKLSAVNAVAFSQSPFTGSQQVQQWPLQMWAAEVSLPSMFRALPETGAEAWLAFLLSLKGRYGTFLLGDPNGRTPRGSAGGSPVINGFSQSGSQLITKGWTPSSTVLKAGDYIAIRDNAILSDVFAANWLGGEGGGTTAPTIGTFVDGTHGTVGSIAFPAVTTSQNTYIYQAQLANYSAESQSVTFSVWLRVPSGTPKVQLAIDDALISTNLGSSSAITLSTTWTKYTLTVTVPVGTTKIAAVLLVNGASIGAQSACTVYGWGAALSFGNYPRLHKTLTDTASDGSGNATLDLWPNLRLSPADTDTITTSNCKGVFRLAENITQWDLDEQLTYGISFKCQEAL